jgi:tetratricopeptide (TPR) repeat protein
MFTDSEGRTVEVQPNNLPMLLSDAERTVLDRISVFADGFTGESAGAVCPEGTNLRAEDVLDILSRLVEKSLVTIDKTEYEAVYSMPAEVRRCSRGRLLESGQAEQLGRRHRDYFLALAEKSAPEFVGPDHDSWLDRIDRTYENFRAALMWCRTDPDGIDASLRMAAALHRYWFMRGHFEEGRMWVKEAMGRASSSRRTPEWAKALRSAGTLALMKSDYVSAKLFLGEALTMFREQDDRGAVAATLISMANTSERQGDFILAQSYGEEALTRFHRLGAVRGIATASSTLAVVLYQMGENRRATTLFQESLAIHRQLGDKVKIIDALLNLGHATMIEGDLDQSESVLQEGLQMANQLELRQSASLALHNLGLAALKRQNYKLAREQLVDGLRIRAACGDTVALACSLEGLAAVAIMEGTTTLGARLFGSAEALRTAVGVPLRGPELAQHQKFIETGRANSSVESFDTECAAGRLMPLSDAIAQALP